MLSMIVLIPTSAHASITVPNPTQFTELTLGGPETLDPAWAYDTASSEVIFNIIQSLCFFDFVDTNRFIPWLSDWWPGYDTIEGHGIQPSPPATHEFTNTTNVDVANPVSSHWTRKGIDYTLTAAGGTLAYCTNINMTWVYDATKGATEDLEYHVEKITLVGNTYHLTVTPLFYNQTWYFHINPNFPWQGTGYGNVTPYDVEYSIERGMVMDHSGGPQWMFFGPLVGIGGSRDGTFNWPKYKYYNASLPDETARLGRRIDDAVESNSTYVWFNLVSPYAPFQQILCQTWGSVLCAQWTINLPADPVGGKNWNASWHVTPGDYHSWIPYNNPPTPGPLGFAANSLTTPKYIGSGSYYLDYVDPASGYWRLKSFANAGGGGQWSKPHLDTVIHEVVLEWADRKARFLSDDPATQADMVTIERLYTTDPDLVAAIDNGRVRYMKDLPTLSADAIFFCYDYANPTPSNMTYMHMLGGVPKRDLLSDRYMRLGLIYSFNASDYIQSDYLGEAIELHDPIIYGIAYANATKHSLMHYTIDIAKATWCFKMAWGGSDPTPMDLYTGIDPTPGDEVPGAAWTQGFEVKIEPFPPGPIREDPVIYIKTVVENLISPTPGKFKVDNIPLAWKTGLTQMYSGNLGAYVVGWIVDFPDPHDWDVPFMATYGDFSYFQCINYGQGKMNWHPLGDYGKGPNNGFPYTNWEGHTLNSINNSYVDGLIDEGIALVDPAVRQKLYTEEEDIFYAEAATLMSVQPSARHYERVWVQGWFYSAIYYGLMFAGPDTAMWLWKEDPATVTYDLESTITLNWTTMDVIFDAHNHGPAALAYEENEAEFFDPTGNNVPICTILPGTTGYYTKSWDSNTQMWTVKSYLWAWLPYCKDTDLFKVHFWCLNKLQYANETIDYSGYHLGIVDVVPGNNFKEITHTPGDIGSAGQWGYFDDHCDYQDLFLFGDAYVYDVYPTIYHPLADFTPPLGTDYLDLFEFGDCYIRSP